LAGGGGGGGKDLKKETQLGLSNKKGEDFPKWYSELVVASELISYYDVSGEWLPFITLSAVEYLFCWGCTVIVQVIS
jgi:hypothetical protein